MSDNDTQVVILMAIEHLKVQYKTLQNPCIALFISRQYRLLSNSNIAKYQQERYAQNSMSWLGCYLSHHRHSQKMQNQLNDFVQFHEFNPLTL